MARTCGSCGETFGFAVVAQGDLEQAFDYGRPWRGLRLLCPGCGALQRVSFGRVVLTNAPTPGLPAELRVHAVVADGPEVIPLPRAMVGAAG